MAVKHMAEDQLGDAMFRFCASIPAVITPAPALSCSASRLTPPPNDSSYTLRKLLEQSDPHPPSWSNVSIAVLPVRLIDMRLVA